MGRAFEFRKARKMKRWSAMAKTFTRIGKDIVMAVKEGGPNPETNSRLRAVIQNAKAANMPKDNVERAIKKASDKDTANFKEVLFEGYAPHGIAILIETATDNNNRTVANIRSYFNKCNGTFGTQGSVEFMFDHTCNFRIPAEGQDVEELELEIKILKRKWLKCHFTKSNQEQGQVQNSSTNLKIEIDLEFELEIIIFASKF